MSSSTPLAAPVAGDERSARRGAKILDSMKDRGLLTPHGEQFLIKSLDPFHDTELGAVDVPDGRSQRVVLKEINQSTTITAPGAGSWDLHVSLLSDLFRQLNQTTGAKSAGSIEFRQVSAAHMSSVAGPNYLSGGLAYQAVAAGSPTFDDTGPNIPSLSPWDQVTGRARVVGAAFEVHNVTEEIYRSGSVTVYRAVNGAQLDSIQFYQEVESAGPTKYWLFAPVLRKDSPPQTEAEALLMPGSRQWAAEDGCYAVGILDDVDAAYKTWDTMGRMYVSAYGYAQSWYGGSVSAAAYSPQNTTQNGVVVPNLVQCFDNNMRNTGAYFTGLSPQTKLRLNVKWLIACQPDSDDPLITLAKPGGAADNLAREIYTRVAERLPPAVPVSENSAGDWFKTILGVVSQAAPVVGAAFGPAGAAIGGGVGALAGIGSSMIPSGGSARSDLKQAEELAQARADISGFQRAQQLQMSARMRQANQLADVQNALRAMTLQRRKKASKRIPKKAVKLALARARQ